MKGKKLNLTADLLKQLNETMNAPAIAEHLGCAVESVRHFAWRNDISLKPHYPTQKHEDCRTLILQDYKWSAKTRGYEFTLTEDEFYTIIQQSCVYCGRSLTNKVTWKRGEKGKNTTRPDFHFTGIDRLDNSIGYTPENCVPCCKQCNIAKSAMTLQEFQEWVSALVNHNKNLIFTN